MPESRTRRQKKKDRLFSITKSRYIALQEAGRLHDKLINTLKAVVRAVGGEVIVPGEVLQKIKGDDILEVRVEEGNIRLLYTPGEPAEDSGIPPDKEEAL